MRCKLGDYIRIKHGFAFKGEYITAENNGVVLVTPGNFEIGGGFKEDKCKYFNGDYPKEYVLSPYDLIVTMTDLSKQGDTLGYSALVPKTNRVYLHNQRIGLVDVYNPKADKMFIYWLMRTQKYQKTIVATSSGSTVKHTSPSRIYDVEVDLPPIDVQKKIAAILSALDEKIAINRAINENLERQAQALFKSWFVDFDSVSKLGFTESELGDIPYGWRIYTLSEFLPVKTGKKNANVSSDKGAYPFFSCSQDFSWTDEYSFEGHAILVAGNGDFNVKWYNGKFEAYQRTYVLIPYVERYTDWLYYAVKYNLESITSAARGSVIKFITKGNLENFAFAAPENLEKCEIIDTFSSINRMINALTQENYQLAEIRDSLLPKLMAGEIDASAAQL